MNSFRQPRQNRKRLFLGILLLSLITGNTSYLHSAKKSKTIALYNFVDQDVPRGMVLIISDVIRETLSKKGAYNVLAWAEVKQILTIKGVDVRLQNDCRTPACLLEVLNVLEIEEMITGQIAKKKNEYYLDLFLVNRNQAGFKNVVSVKSPSDASFLIQITQDACRELMGLIPPEQARKADPQERPAMTKDEPAKPDPEELLAAARNGELNQVKRLLEQGADLNSHGLAGEWTALHLAVLNDDTELVQLLIRSGAALDVQDSLGRTPLHYAAQNGQVKSLKLLLASNAKINAHDKQGWTPLHEAASRNHKQAVRLLLARGADINVEMQNGDTPLSLAEKWGHKDMVALLRKHGARKKVRFRKPSK